MNLTLPIKDNVLFIDNSSFEEYTTCPRKYEFYALHKRQAVDAGTALNFGRIIHAALEAHYKGNDPMAVIAEEYKHWQAPFDDHRNEAFAMSLLSKYREEYPSEPFQILDGNAVELPFAVELLNFEHSGLNGGTPFKVMWTGKIDLITAWDDGLWIVDHKTSSMTGDSYWRAFENNNAQRGYCWATQQVLGRPVLGFMINVISSRRPAVRSTGKTPFERQKFLQPQESLAEWEENTIAILQTLFDEVASGYLPMKTAWCGQWGGCKYLPVCTTPPAARNTVLYSGLYEPVTWSPLHK